MEFKQLVAPGGYRWIQGAREPGRTPELLLADAQLLPLGMLGYGGHAQLGRTFNPFSEHPTLFREFASVGDDAERILQFANAYGSLGYQRFQVTVTGKHDARWPMEVEPLQAWRAAQHRIARAVEIWDLAHRGDRRQLQEWFSFMKGMTLFAVAEGRGKPVGNFEYSVHGHRNWEDAQNPCLPQVPDGKPGDLVTAGKRFVQEEINAQVAKTVTVIASWDADRGRLALRMRPHHLLGALWLQLARAVSGHITYRQCAHRACDRWLEISTDSSDKAYRTNREYCSTNCRIREFRRRQKEK